MSITLSGQPLAASETPPTNYEIDGPKHRLLWREFPRRMRAEHRGRVVLETGEAHLLHESEMLPVPYVPEGALDWELLAPSETTTHCPFKGDASYWHLRVDGEQVEDAIWTYPEPNQESEWLRGHYGVYFGKLEQWYDEEEPVRTHLRDPYTRIDVRRSRRRVRVTAGETVVAESERPWVLSETGLANRFYIPTEDVREELLAPSETRTHCPYKGDARYHHLELGGGRVEDAAWSYPEPLDGVTPIAGALSFESEELTVDVSEPAGT